MKLLYLILPQVQTGPAANTSDTANPLGWLLGCILAAGVVAIVARPLLLAESAGRRRTSSVAQTGPQEVRIEGLTESAQAEEQIIADLEFDHEMGIIEERDYNEIRERSSRKLEVLNTQINLLQHSLNGMTASRTVTLAPPSVVPKPARPVKAQPSASDKLHVKSVIKEKMKCSECATPFKPGERFCQKCATPLPIFCLQCGNEVTEDDRFCAKCGSAVNT